MKPLHFIHKKIASCPGYQDFLEVQSLQKNYKFNFWFFLASPFWLVHNKMVGHYILMILLYLSLSNLTMSFFGPNPEVSGPFYLTTISTLHVFFSFFSHYLYQLNLENKFSAVQYDSEKCLKISKPYPIYVQVLIHVLVPIVVLIIYVLCLSLLAKLST